MITLITADLFTNMPADGFKIEPNFFEKYYKMYGEWLTFWTTSCINYNTCDANIKQTKLKIQLL